MLTRDPRVDARTRRVGDLPACQSHGSPSDTALTAPHRSSAAGEVNKSFNTIWSNVNRLIEVESKSRSVMDIIPNSANVAGGDGLRQNRHLMPNCKCVNSLHTPPPPPPTPPTLSQHISERM